MHSAKRFTVAFWTDSGKRAFPFSHPVHRLTYTLRRLSILSQTEVNLWMRISALFRPDPYLRLLEELEEDSRQTVQEMRVRGFAPKLKSTSYTPQGVRLIIMSSYNMRQTDSPLPSADTSSSQARGTGGTQQPAKSPSPASSSGHSTSIASAGSRTGSLHNRRTYPPAPAAANDRRSRSRLQKDKDLTELEKIITSSSWLEDDTPEPICGSPDCPDLANNHGIRGKSCYTAFVDTKSDGTYGCWYKKCSQYSTKSLEVAVKHQRSAHFSHKPFLCVPKNGTDW